MLGAQGRDCRRRCRAETLRTEAVEMLGLEVMGEFLRDFGKGEAVLF